MNDSITVDELKAQLLELQLKTERKKQRHAEVNKEYYRRNRDKIIVKNRKRYQNQKKLTENSSMLYSKDSSNCDIINKL